jgi:flagellar biosynthesis anti-sigma factor FlgM
METRKVSGQAAQLDQTAGAGRPQNAANAAANGAGTQSPKLGANVAVSPQARQLADAHKKAFEIAKATPDVREERVAALKKQIQAGTYKPDPGKIADGIAREALLEYLAESDSKTRV